MVHKLDRNNEIKRLWATGTMSQPQIAAQFGIKQSRISAIVHDRRPKNKYCAHCHARVCPTKGICDKCREKNIEKRLAKKDARLAFVAQRRAERALLKQQKEEERAKEVEEALEKEVQISKPVQCFACQRPFVTFTENAEREMYYCAKCTELMLPQQGRERTRMIRRIRDNFTCQRCGRIWKTGQRHFDNHHINGLCGKRSRLYDKVEDLDGLITYCHKCHFAQHEVREKTLRRIKDDVRKEIYINMDLGYSDKEIAAIAKCSHSIVYRMRKRRVVNTAEVAKI